MSPQRRNAAGGGPQSAADPAAGVLTRGSPESRSGVDGPSSKRHPSASRPAQRHTCGGCDATWAGFSACHCSGCHRTFGGVDLFDKHRSAASEHGICRDPATITGKHGQSLMFLRAGVWRGPELTDEERARAKGGWTS